MGTELKTKLEALNEKITVIDDQEKIRNQEETTRSESNEKLTSTDLEWRAKNAQHEAIQHGLSMRTEEASTHSSTTLREMEDKVTLQKATNKDSMKEYKLNQKKELENLKNEKKKPKKSFKKKQRRRKKKPMNCRNKYVT